MFHHPPILPYSGLCIVLDNPSRFDLQNKKLISGMVGDFFAENLGVSLNACHIYDSVEPTLPSIPEGTKVILLLGESTTRRWANSSNSIHKLRGIPFLYNGIPVIPSYLPQETFDAQPFEASKNPMARVILEEAKSVVDTKDRARTSRATWRFWLQQDMQKAVKLLRQFGGIIPTTRPTYVLYPTIPELLAHFATLPPTASVYFDIETDSALNILCFGLCDSVSSVVYSVPLLRHDYVAAYAQDWPKLFRLLGTLFLRNQIVIHNSMFDLSVLALKYNIAPPLRIYDTMLAQARIYPEAAKSLGHCISLWTWERFHKDDGIFMPHNMEQAQKLWQYNATDVWTMRLVHEAQVAHASLVRGLPESIEQVNSSVRDYLLMSLMGVQYNEEKRAQRLAELDATLTQYLRVLRLLVGFELLPTSPKGLNNYLVHMMGYKPLSFSSKGNPSWGSAELIKLRLQHPENVAVFLIMRYKTLAKSAGELKFRPYKTKEQPRPQLEM